MMLVKNPRPILLLLTVLGVALLLRLPGLTRRGPWLDERVSLNTAVGSTAEEPAPHGTLTPGEFWNGNSLSNVLRANRLSDGLNGLPYHLALHVWIRLFGPSPGSVRGLSLVLGMVTVALVWATARRLFGEGYGLAAAALCGLHPLLVILSQELRPYSFAIAVLLSATFSTVAFAHSESSAGPRRLLLGGVSGCLLALAFMSHYSSAVLVACHLLGLLLLARRPELRAGSWLALAVFASLMLVWFIPLGGRDGLAFFAAASEARRQAVVAGDPQWAWLHPPTPRFLLAGVGGVLLTLLGSNLQTYIRVVFLLPLLAIPLLYLRWALTSGETRRELPSYLAFAALALGGGLALALVTAIRSGHDSALVSRYFAFFVPYLTPLFVLGIYQGWKHGCRSRALVSLHALVLVGSLGTALHQQMSTQTPDVYAGLAQSLTDCGPTALAAAYPTWMDARTVSLYLGRRSPLLLTVDTSLKDEIRVSGSDGRIVLRLPIDRARAR